MPRNGRGSTRHAAVPGNARETPRANWVPGLEAKAPQRLRATLATAYTTPATAAEAGMVSTQAHTIRRATPQRTAESRRVAPTPMIAEEITWVVLTGTPASAVPARAIPPPVSAQKPW